MPHLLVIILDDLEHMPDLLQAWKTIGVPGVTILESVGGYRAGTWLSRVGLGALGRLFEAEEVRRRTLLAAIEDELRFVLITSYARVHSLEDCPQDAVDGAVPGLNFRVRVTPSAHAKCIRCWHHREDVGTNPGHPEICGRCVTNVTGSGEQRRFA